MQENDDIDLRPYVVAIIRRWPWIVGAVLLAVAVSAGLTSMLPKTYTATAAVLVFIRQTGSQVGTNDPVLNIETIDVGSRRQGLLALAESEAIESRIAPDVLAQVAPDNYQPGMLVEHQHVTIEANGDLIAITADGQTPQQAQTLANAWATTYVDYVKTLYTDEHSSIQLASSALPPFEPSAPSIGRNAVIAGLLAAIGSISLIVLLQLTRTSIALPQRAAGREQAANYPSTN